MSGGIAIVGGGIGGLTLALALEAAKLAHPIRIFEAAAKFHELGVGINLGPHAIRELAKLGLEPALAAVACEPIDYAFFTRNGQLVYREPWGKAAGYRWPHFSFHRAALHKVLLDAVRERLGADAIATGRRCVAAEGRADGVTLHLRDANGKPAASVAADAAIGCDGIHSALRAGLYPGEGAPVFHGFNLWRGVTRHPPILTGRSIVRIGATETTLILYPIRDRLDADGNQLVNWVAEVKTATPAPVDWSAPGRLADFFPLYRDWRFDWLDCAALIERAEFVLSYPMVDRDPLPRWSFGRVTLLGDAAHPMYPRGGNGGAQAILDAACLAQCLAREADPAAAFTAYEAARREATARIVLQNRNAPPNLIVDTVERRTGGQRFERLEEVVSAAELKEIFDAYRRVAGYHIELVNKEG